MKKIKKYDGVVENTIEAFACLCECGCFDGCSCACPEGNDMVTYEQMPSDGGCPQDKTMGSTVSEADATAETAL